ncbi:MAG: hypothetical protein WC763_02655 [Candidatus Paceibacterota bacterium]|jgi:hypothetical protein
MSKKTFTLLIALIIAIIAFLGWFFFFRTTTPVTPGTTQQGTDLFPFGPGSTSTRPSTPTNSGTSTIDLSNNTPAASLPRLRQLWKDPTAGATFFPATGTTTSVRFVDRATGHIYESPLDALGNEKISNVTIPQIHEALWAANGKEVIFRYLKNDSIIQSFYATLSTTSASTTSTLEGYFLPANIRDISISGGKIAYFDPTLQTGQLIEARVDGTARKAVMNSEAWDWSITYNNPKVAFLGTRPSGLVPGFGYALDMATGATTRIAGEILGLTGTINASGTKAFLSAQEQQVIASAAYDIKTKVTQNLSIRTLSDKCAWSNVKSQLIYCAVPVSLQAGTYPDDWYKGKVSFTDRLWSIDLSTGETRQLLDPSFEVLQDMDIMKIVIDRTDSSLTFINKNDMSLWLYRP